MKAKNRAIHIFNACIELEKGVILNILYVKQCFARYITKNGLD